MTKAIVGGEFPIGDEETRAEAVRANARWRFVQAISGACPEVFEALYKQVYPKFCDSPSEKPDYWEYRWSFERWQRLLDGDGRLTPFLKDWSRRFSIDESWFLEGALQTMHYWLRASDLREKRVPHGFRPFVAGSILIHDHEHKFDFNDRGWDPQFERWLKFKTRIEDRFLRALADHKDKVRSLARKRGLVKKPPVCSDEHFEWLALFKCGRHTLKQIRDQYRSVGDKSTISKGLHKAASLAETDVPARRKLKAS